MITITHTSKVRSASVRPDPVSEAGTALEFMRLLFCHTPEVARHRIGSEQLTTALGAQIPEGAYCLWHAKDRTTILDCYVPGPETPVATVCRHVKKMFHAARQLPVFATAIKDLRYGIAVIVHTPERRKAIMDAIRTKGSSDKLPLIKRVWIRVEALPELGALLGTGSTGRRTSATSIREESLPVDIQGFTASQEAVPLTILEA